MPAAPTYVPRERALDRGEDSHEAQRWLADRAMRGQGAARPPVDAGYDDLVSLAAAPRRASPAAQIQAFSTVSRGGDAAEREADQIAEQVTTDARVQRAPVQGATCPKCKEASAVQRAVEPAPSSASVPTGVVPDLGAGAPLDASTRAYFEPRLGFDMGHVRVHTDARAARSAIDMSALAYTAGRDIVFAPGQYAPASGEGKKLLAHELVHVQQQGQGGASGQVQRKLGPSPYDCTQLQQGATQSFTEYYYRKTGKPVPNPVFDGFGHCFVACCTAQSRGTFIASILGGAYEFGREHLFGGEHDSYAQDKRNEAVGRGFGGDPGNSCALACTSAAFPRQSDDGAAAPPLLDFSAPVTRQRAYPGGKEQITYNAMKVVGVRVRAGGSVTKASPGEAIAVAAARGGVAIEVDLLGSPSPIDPDTVHDRTVQVQRRGGGNIPGAVAFSSAPLEAVRSLSRPETIRWTSLTALRSGSYVLTLVGSDGIKSKNKVPLDGAGVGGASSFTLDIEVGGP